MKRWVRTAVILAAVFGCAAAILLGVFRIRSVDIRGNERYSARQISDDLIYDFKTRNTLFFVWKYHNRGTAEDAPYLSSVHAVMLSPTSVRIEVSENQLAGRVQYNGQNVYYDDDGIVQEITDSIYSGIPLVTGVEIEEPVLYQRLTMDNASTLRTMLSITQLLIQNELIPDSVSFDSSGNMTLRLGTVIVKLGQDEYLEEKIANLVSIYPQIQGQSGTLNMEGFTGKNEAITFKSDSEQESEAGESGSETEDSGSSGILAGEGTGDETGSSAGSEDGSSAQDGDSASSDSDDQTSSDEATGSGFMVFDSSGTLRYDARVVDGQVVDSYGNIIDGCTVDENGNVVDAYWNVIDPSTGQLAQ